MGLTFGAIEEPAQDSSLSPTETQRASRSSQARARRRMWALTGIDDVASTLRAFPPKREETLLSLSELKLTFFFFSSSSSSAWLGFLGFLSLLPAGLPCHLQENSTPEGSPSESAVSSASSPDAFRRRKSLRFLRNSQLPAPRSSLFLFFFFFKLSSFMAKTKPGRKDVDSYKIKGTNKVVRPGDSVLMRPSESGKPPYVGRVEKIEADHRNDVKVRVRWYYRPEEAVGGRRQFHGAKELFLSDHFDVQSAHTIEGKCIVHTFKNYTKLEDVGAEDYFYRFEYTAATGGFTPDGVAVYCKCEMPYNPDDLMVQCEGCKDWFHPSCVGMTIEDAKKLDPFLCSDCSPDDHANRSLNHFPVSPSIETKVEPKRRKR